MKYLGIDPGLKGGLALINENGSFAAFPYSDSELLNLCRCLTDSEARCCLEKVSAMPGQGVVSMFSLGQSVGYIKGVLEAFRIPYQEITPKKWKGEFGLNSNKAASIEVCRRLFPSAVLRASSRERVDKDGMAEALLMAEYARRKL